mmetsp:Transcript_112723/g.363941  ORF Transcript_112723/g.363941 Transcript_112723/m.363941 type:complete len:228 (-) Transcript_112723:428-1111(-)
MAWPPLTARGRSSIRRVCHQCVSASQGEVERMTRREEPSRCASNQPARPWMTPVSCAVKEKSMSKLSSCSRRSVRKSNSSRCGAARSLSGWNWSCNGRLYSSDRALASSEERSTPKKSLLVQGYFASAARPRCSTSSAKGERQSVALLGNIRPPGFRKRSRARTTDSMPRSAKRKLPRVSLTMQSTFSGTSSRTSCTRRFTTTTLSAQPLASARRWMASATGEASTQ